jgi:hypothetical protein
MASTPGVGEVEGEGEWKEKEERGARTGREEEKDEEVNG